MSDEKNPNIRYQGFEVDGFVPATNGVEIWVPRNFRRTGCGQRIVMSLSSSASSLEVDLDALPGISILSSRVVLWGY